MDYSSVSSASPVQPQPQAPPPRQRPRQARNSTSTATTTTTTTLTDTDTATPAKKFRCPTCDRSFTKSEHLARHARSHSKVKPYVCSICSKAFGRQDVLARHKKVHNNSKDAHAAGSWGASETAQNEFRNEPQDGVHSEIYDQSPAGNYPPPSFPHEETVPQNQLEPSQPWTQGGDMLDFLLSDTNTHWPVTLPVVQFESSAIQPDLEDSVIPQFNQQSGPLPGHGPGSGSGPTPGPGPGHHAMHQLSKLIADLSSGLTAEIESTGITSGFLDTCLHVFFERFHTSFPVLHKATFQVRESSHPLLLNIIALGSLFVGAKDAIPKGEALWRLAHTAVATSWQALMSTRGPRDECDGVQLVLTALTGQTYALLSKNQSLRMTSQVFHGLGFYWARQCGWYNMKEYNLADVPSLDTPEYEKNEAWRVWAAREVQNRAILGHYILDGQISQFSGHSPSARHVTNSLLTPTCEDAFAASTANDWILEMGKLQSGSFSFRELYVMLSSKGPDLYRPDYRLSNFSIRVILEGMQSLVSDLQDGGGVAVGTPSQSEIAWTLLRLHRERLGHSDQTSVENMELLVRWHAICLNLATPATMLCQRLCSVYNIKQHLHRDIEKKDTTPQELDLPVWANSIDGRRALLHAMAIQDLVDRLPLGRSHAIHLPAAIFAVATIYSARCIANLSTISVPKSILWEDVWSIRLDLDNAGTPNETQDQKNMDAFLRGREASETKTTEHRVGRNLMYDLNSLQITLSSMSLRWGVSHAMDDILNLWIGIANGAVKGV
ncbi:C2H2 type zinc finger domain protein [Phlyctema vagabunda]|uniref:C2H2 type zinc finger domain protein n=1 Tax=Phlyctema vagabunda TaxID=108571 RepID=A0ABR4PU14_9HELO